MKIVDRHIGGHVIWGTLLALAVLLALFTFVAFVDDVQYIGRGNYTLVRAFEYILLTTPYRVFQLFPLAALLGTLVGLGQLAANSELRVIRTSGVSMLQIALAALRSGALLVLIAMLIGELLVPVTEPLAKEQRASALESKLSVGERGVWVRDGHSYINVRTVMPDNEMRDIYIYEFDKAGRLRAATHADRARYKDGSWRLSGIRQSLFDARGVRTRAMRSAQWRSLFEPNLVKVVAVTPESLSVLGLYRYIKYLHKNGLNAGAFEIAMWSKFVYPLATGVMILLALPLVLGRMENSGLGQRIVVGALVGIAFHVVQVGSARAGQVYGLTPSLVAVGPTVAFLALALVLMRRAR